MTLLQAILAGIGAGYAVAIPVGAVAVLIVETGARRGFRVAAAAGLGAATADLVYASLAVLVGGIAAAVLAPWATPVRWVSVAVLGAIGLRLLGDAFRPKAEVTSGAADARSGGATYLAFVGITLLNPTTVAYFAALALGLPALGSGTVERLAFASAAFAASASWQLALAGFGALLHAHASPGLMRTTTVAGGLLILGFAAAIALGLLGV